MNQSHNPSHTQAHNEWNEGKNEWVDGENIVINIFV